MKFAELKATLKTSLAPVYLIHGTDYYLVSKAIELITDAANVNKDLDVSRLDESASAQTIIESAAPSRSLAASVLLLSNLSRKTSRNISKNQIQNVSLSL